MIMMMDLPASFRDLLLRASAQSLESRSEESETSETWHHNRPVVNLTWAQSLDGCLARDAGRPLQLSAPESAHWTHLYARFP